MATYHESKETIWVSWENPELEIQKYIAWIRRELALLKSEITKIDHNKLDELWKQLTDLDKTKRFIVTQMEWLESYLDIESWWSTWESIKLDEEGWESDQELDELQELSIRIMEYKREYNELLGEIKAIKRTLETLVNNQLTEEELQKFQNISNIDFLQYPTDERLRFITVGNFSADDVASGKYKNIEFTFTYDWVFNRDLYIRTTAGQVFPSEVRQLTSWTEVFTRSGLSGEFFTESGKRLKIHEGTKVDVSSLVTQEELKNLQDEIQAQKDVFLEDPFKDLADAALNRWIDPKFTIIMFGSKIEKTSWIERGVIIEDKLTDIARFQDDFSDEFPGRKTFQNGIVTEAFAWYLVNILQGDIDALIRTYGFSQENLQKYKKSARYKSGGPLLMYNVDIQGVSQEKINKVLKMKRFVPWSSEAQILFTVAAQSAWLDVSWAKNPATHELLRKESAWRVGVLNFTIPKSYTTESFRSIAMTRRNNNPIGVESTASGLGQLTLTNVDMYYPDWRAGIGDALNEAVGMLRYIHNRRWYWTPERALAFHHRKWWY